MLSSQFISPYALRMKNTPQFHRLRSQSPRQRENIKVRPKLQEQIIILEGMLRNLRSPRSPMKLHTQCQNEFIVTATKLNIKQESLKKNNSPKVFVINRKMTSQSARQNIFTNLPNNNNLTIKRSISAWENDEIQDLYQLQ